MELSFFRRSGESLVPTTWHSMWSENQMHGVAVSGALARALEERVEREGLDEFRAGRVTVDLFRPATMDPCLVTAEVVRRAGGSAWSTPY